MEGAIQARILNCQPVVKCFMKPETLVAKWSAPRSLAVPPTSCSLRAVLMTSLSSVETLTTRT